MEADQEDLKCLLSIGSQERIVQAIRLLSPLALIWKYFNLDLGLLQREPSCIIQAGDIEGLKLSSSNGDRKEGTISIDI